MSGTFGDAARAVARVFDPTINEMREVPKREWARGFKGRRDKKVQQKVVGLAVTGRVSSELSPQYRQLMVRAVQRIQAIKGNGFDALALVAALTNYLDKCKLTVNFCAFRDKDNDYTVWLGQGWFCQPCTYDSYKQAFEIRTGEDYLGRKRDLVPDMMAGEGSNIRAANESTKIVHAEPQRGKMLSGAVSRFSDPRRPDDQGVAFKPLPDNNKLLAARNPHFVGASRPRYAALNYTNNPNGAVPDPLYGLSCFVLKDHLKNLATYCAADSKSDKVTAQTICTRKTLGALLAWMDDAILENLLAAWSSGPTKNLIQEGKAMCFLECHMYSDVTFLSEVEEMHLSLREVGDKHTKQHKNAKEFAKKWKIPIVMVP